jgi:putative endonuclease
MVILCKVVFNLIIIMFYVYVLKSQKDGEKYIGSTNNLHERIKLHNNGKIISTRARYPFELVYYEAYKSEQDARKREISLKLRSRALTQLKKRLVFSLA